MTEKNIAIVLHGGAGDSDQPKERAAQEPILKQALDTGWSILKNGGDGEVAVCAAIRLLESSEYFDAGYGSYPNVEDQVFMDVSLMHGDGRFASYMNIPKLMHPSSLALDALNRNESMMRVWTDSLDNTIRKLSEDKISEYGYKEDPGVLISPHAQAVTSRARAKIVEPRYSTVGCVVRDKKGNIVAGTSTGGTPNKPVGRIGDSPIIGAGTFADNNIGGLSATGHGESFLGSLISSFIICKMRESLRKDRSSFSKSPTALEQIIQEEFGEMKKKYKQGRGGLIVLPVEGAPVVKFNSLNIACAYRYINNDGGINEKAEVLINEANKVTN